MKLAVETFTNTTTQCYWVYEEGVAKPYCLVQGNLILRLSTGWTNVTCPNCLALGVEAAVSADDAPSLDIAADVMLDHLARSVGMRRILGESDHDFRERLRFSFQIQPMLSRR